MATTTFAGLWLAVKLLPILEALAVAGLLAYLLHPVAQWFARNSRMAYRNSAGLVLLGFLILLAVIPATLGTVFWSRFKGIVDSAFDVTTVELNGWLSQSIDLFFISLSPQDLFENLNAYLADLLAPLPAQSFNVLSGISLNIFWVVLVFVCAYYLLRDGPRAKTWVLARLPQVYRPEITVLIEKLDVVWRVFLRVQLLIFLILAVLFGLGTVFVVWLFTAGVLPFSLILLIVLLIVVYTAAQQVDNLWLRPRWMGRSLDLHPGLVLASLLAALAIGGILLALLIVPLIATAKVVGGYIYRKLMDLPPWPELAPESEIESANDPDGGAAGQVAG